MKTTLDLSKISETTYNLYLHKAGAHNVGFYTSMGRGIAEKKDVEYGRMKVGVNDIAFIEKHCSNPIFKLSQSKSSCYLMNVKECEEELRVALKK